MPDTLINEAAKKQSEGSGDTGFKFSDPGVGEAAKKALSPEFLESSSEKIIDGSFDWLNQREVKPTFSIDVQSAKQTFATSLSEHAKTRYAGLPACAPGTLPKSSSVLTIDCQPNIAFDIDAMSNLLTAELASSPEFLPEATLNSDNILSSAGKQSPFEKLSMVPKAYGWLQLAPLVLGVLLVLSALGVIFLAKDKREGLVRVGRRLTFSGITALVILIAGWYAIGKLREKFTAQTDATSAAYAFKEVFLSLINAVRGDVLKTGGLVAGALLLAGGIILIVLKLTAPKVPEFELPKKDIKQPEPKVEEPPKPGVTKSASGVITGQVAPEKPKSPPKRKPPLIQ